MGEAISDVTINSYRVFRRNWGGRRYGEFALYIKRWIKCEGLSLQKNHGQVKSLWVRIGDKSDKGIPVGGVYYRSRGPY